ncbi:nucleotidyltransferase family protein [Neorhizobium sp. JUb45]|uniref:nucleotidyltransferase family protein n=1 Tax=unclassified Neorhizobium TaxID=2629175 RepID=UPI0010440FE2|nr:nucleotidyltransferase family protein [Neorhizobium sp. JUb45]TCR00550.1 molybdenum cofactor cytidylyltransferase [Neorhizobium sp. JUb45]
MDEIPQTAGKLESSRSPSVSIVMLAAGQSSRMKEQGHKLLARFDGVPFLRKSVLSAIGSDSQSVVVVIGEQHSVLRETIADLDMRVVENLGSASGLASSIRVGVMAAEPDKPDGVLIALADMPAIETVRLDRLIAAFREHQGERVIRATANGRPGNPVIFPSSWFERLKGLAGDVGARALLKDNAAAIVDVEIGEAAFADVDTPEELIAAGGVPFTGNAQGTVCSTES